MYYYLCEKTLFNRIAYIFLIFYRKDTKVAGTMSGHASWVLGVSFAPDGKKFASSSSDHTVKVWELAQRQCLHTFREHTDQVNFLKYLLIFPIHNKNSFNCYFTLQAWGVKYHPTKNNLLVSVAEDKAVNLYEHPE